MHTCKIKKIRVARRAVARASGIVSPQSRLVAQTADCPRVHALPAAGCSFHFWPRAAVLVRTRVSLVLPYLEPIAKGNLWYPRGEWNTLRQGASRPPTTTRPPLSRGPTYPPSLWLARAAVCSASRGSKASLPRLDTLASSPKLCNVGKRLHNDFTPQWGWWPPTPFGTHEMPTGRTRRHDSRTARRPPSQATHA
jgi:hypothetical protein